MSFVFEELEPRIMYSADFAPGLVDEAGWQPDGQVRLAEDATPALSTQIEQRRKEVVFVDAGVVDYRSLIDAIDGERSAAAELEFFLIDADHDGVEQITTALEQRHDIAAVHIVSHGSAASLQLGNTSLDAQSLTRYVDALQQWRGALTSEADLLLYGCDVATGAQGEAFLRQLGMLTGADVAASDDATGGAGSGGDWLLESRYGAVEAASLGQDAAMQAWGGLLGNEFAVNTTTSNDQTTAALTRGSQQAIAYDGAGNFVVVWSSKSQDDAGTDGVYARRFTDDGTPLTGEILVNATVTDEQNMARVVSDAAGNFVVTWTSNQQDGDTTGVYVRRFDASGIALSGEIAVNTTTTGEQRNSVIAMDRSSGNFVVVWEGEGSGDGDGIFFRRFAADGSALDANERRVNTSDSGTEGNAAVAMDTSGRFVVAFDVNNKMYFQRFDATGATQGGRTQVDNIASNSTGAAIAMDAAGNFTLVYREQNTFTGVWGRGYMSDGTQRYSWFYAASGDATSPSIAMAGDGSFVLTFQKTGPAGIEVYAQKFNANSSANGSAFIVNETASGDQTEPSIALFSADRFAVVWGGNAATDNKGVSARVFALANTAPSIALPGGALNYVSGDAPTPIDASATVADAESPNFGTGTLTVSFTANGSADDRLLIANQGIAAGQIGISGNAITYGGITIGSFVGGTNGSTPLVVTLNHSATPAASQALLRSVQYHNVSGTPSTLTRSLQVVLTDGDGGTSTVATTAIQVADVNQPPSSSGGSVTGVEDTSRIFSWADFNITDADSAIGATTAVRLTTLPAVEVLEYFNGSVWTRVGLGQVFTKADIDAGLLRLTPLADESGYDGYAIAGVGNLKQDYAQFSFTPIHATIETIVNPGGEADGLADGASQTGAAGWSQAGNNAGVQNLVASSDTFAIDDDASLFVDAGGALTQTLAATFSSARNYNLSFEFGWRGDAAFYPTEPGFKVEVYAGATLLGEFNETYITGVPGTFVTGVLALDGSLSGATNGSALQIRLTGTWTQANFDNFRLISFDRGIDIGGAAQMNVDITPVNDAPINNVPGAQSVNEDTALSIAGLSIADVDAATASTQLAVSNGRLNVNLAGGASISAGANNSGALTLSGTLAQINAALATLNYQGIPNFNGSDNLQIVTNDLGSTGAGGALSDTDSIAITVNAVNDVPAISSQTFNLAENSPNTTVVGNVGASDVDAGDTLTYAITAGNSGGAFSIDAAGQIRVANSAALDFETTPSFNLNVRVTDAGGLIANAAITINLINVNETPANTVPAAQSVNEDTALLISGISVSDVDGNIATVQASVTNGRLNVSLAGGATITAGANGSAGLRLAGTQAQINAALATISYQGNNNFTGGDVLTLVSADGGGLSDNDTVNITVSPINDTPSVANALADQTATEDLPFNFQFAVNTFGDIDTGDSLSYTASGMPAWLNFNAATRTFSGTPGNADVGSYAITVRATDLSGAFVEDQFNINVVSVNDAPVISAPAPQSMAEDGSLVFSAANGNAIAVDDVDAGANPIEIALAVSNGVLSLNGTAGLTFVSGDGSGDASMIVRGTVANINAALDGMTFTPDANYFGAANLSLVTLDSTLVALNTDAALRGYYSFENAAALGADGSPSASANGTVFGANALVDGVRGNVLDLNASQGDYVHVPGLFGNAPNVTLSAWIKLASTDPLGADVLSLGDSMSLRITNTGRLSPFFYNGVTWMPLSNATPLAGTGWHHAVYQFDDAGNQHRLYLDGALVNSAATTDSIVYSLGVDTFIGRHGNGQTRFFPGQLDDVRVYSRVLTAAEIATLASDVSLRATSNVAITVTPVNDAPVAADDSYGVNENGTLTIGALGGALSNDGDIENAPLTAALVSGPANGSLTLNANGSFVYTPNANFSGSDSFTYRASDGNLDSSIATVSINVNSVNTVPFIVTNSTANVAEGGSVVIDAARLLVDDFDNSPAQIVYTITGAPANGALMRSGVTLTVGSQFTQQDINANLLTYTHDGGESTGDAFFFTVSDGLGGTLAATSFTINVALVNDAPVITSDGGGASAAVAVAENGVAVTTVVASDADLPANTLGYTISGGADAALFAIEGASGALRFLGTPNFEAPVDANGDNVYEVTVQVDDGNGGIAVQSLSVSITNVNETPAHALPGSLSATEDTLLSINGIAVSDEDGDVTTVSLSVTHGSLSVDLSGGASIGAGANGSANLTLAGTQAQLNAALTSIRYQPLPNANGSDILSIVSIDTAGLNDSDVIAIDVAAVNDAPTIVAAQLTVAEGESVTVRASEIGAADVEQSAAQLVFSVFGVSGGRVEFVGHPGTAITSFTQGDIEAARVRFVHDGSEAVPSLMIAVSDGAASDGPYAVTVNFANLNDVPALTLGSATLGDTGTVVFDTRQLSAIDVDNAPAELVFTLLSGPNSGRLEFGDTPGVAVTRFTQSDIDAGRLRYVHTGTGQDDGFAFAVSDGSASIEASFTVRGHAIQSSSQELLTLPASPTADSEAASTDARVDTQSETRADRVQSSPVEFSPVSRGEGDTTSPVIVAIAVDSNGSAAAAGPSVNSASASRRTVATPAIGFTNSVQATASPGNFTLQATSGEKTRSAQITVELTDTRYMRQLDQARGQMDDEMKFDKIAIGSSIAASTGLSIGYVLWLLRGGVLVSSLLSSLPAWRMIDPLPVLGKSRDDDEDADEESLQSLVKKHWPKRRQQIEGATGSADSGLAHGKLEMMG